MANQKEQAAILKGVKDTLDAANVKLGKIGTETDGLKQKVADLEEIVKNLPDASQELIDAVAAVKGSSDTLSATVQVVDDKVEDPAAPPAEEGTGEETTPQ